MRKTTPARFARWTLIVIAAVLLGILSLSFWFYPHWQWRTIEPQRHRNTMLTISRGNVAWSRQYATWYNIPDFQFQLIRPGASPPRLLLYPSLTRWPAGFWLAIPLAYPALLAGAAAAILWSWERRRKPGACASCGYDRAGLSHAAACPECGNVPCFARTDKLRT